MSARYSSSPTLRLRIAESRICALWQGAFVLALLLSLLLLGMRGYPWMAVAFAVMALSQVSPLCRQPIVGLVVHWRSGCWFIERDGVETRVVLQPSCRVSPLGIYLCWSAQGGQRESAWLFADSAAPDQLRRLRVRLALENPL